MTTAGEAHREDLESGSSEQRSVKAARFRSGNFGLAHLRDLEESDLGTRSLDLLGDGLGEGTDVAVCEEFGRKGRTRSVCVFPCVIVESRSCIEQRECFRSLRRERY